VRRAAGSIRAESILTDLRTEDFQRLRAKWADNWGPARLANEINRARAVFNYAKKNGIIPASIVFGERFKRPSQQILRPNRAKKGPYLSKEWGPP
jgi:hypothetical protein